MKALIFDNNELSLLIGTLCLAGFNYEHTPVLAGLVHPKGAKAWESPFLSTCELFFPSICEDDVLYSKRSQIIHTRSLF